jgi:N-acetylglucosaminyl-diphospho-decaprenol L-rhamnosyltransferase
VTISVSIVSHGQAAHVEALLRDLDQHCEAPLEFLVTLNVAEPLHRPISSCRFPLTITTNSTPKGFGANHNAAFARAKGKYFCVLNPDIRMHADPFPTLVDCLAQANVGVCAPSVFSPEGHVEDSAREFPTPLSILAKTFGHDLGVHRVTENANSVYPDWVAGMFMLFPSSAFRTVGGFDERYHLYYEDVDLCARLRLTGYEVALCPKAKVIHDARRQSHRSPRHFAWHVVSMVRFFTSAPYRRIRRRYATRNM